MDIIFLVVLGILGLIVGSFLNVVVYRYNTGKGMDGRSMCLACKKTLFWHELVPLVSFVVQRGRCRGCSARFSPQYAIVECITGIGFMLVAYSVMTVSVGTTALPAIVFGCALVVLFVMIAVYDIRHFIMPDVWVFAFIALTALQLFFPILTDPAGSVFMVPSWNTIVAGVLVPLPFFLLWFFSQGRLLGFGDVKFMIGMGLLLGLSRGVTAVIFAFWIGTVWIVLVYVFRAIMRLLSTHRLVSSMSQRIIKKEIPFAPFLIIATFLVFVTRFNLITYLVGF